MRITPFKEDLEKKLKLNLPNIATATTAIGTVAVDDFERWIKDSTSVAALNNRVMKLLISHGITSKRLR